MTRRRTVHGVVIGWLLILLPQAVAVAGIYKWVDANGITHYSESSPEDVPAREVEIEPPPVIDSREREQRQRRIEQAYDERGRHLEAVRRSREQKRQAEADERRQRREQCGHALVQLRVLEKAQPVYRDEEGNLHTQRSPHSAAYQGKRVYLDDEARKAAVARFERIVGERCDRDEPLAQQTLARLLADYHERQCQAARDLLVELTRMGVERRAQDRIGVEQDVARHCFQVEKR